jgi:hypothetical protein
MGTSFVIALCLFINGQLIEHRIQDSISDCLKHKREAERNMGMENKKFMCGEVEAEITKNVDGSITIEKLIMNNGNFRYCYCNNWSISIFCL